MKRLLLSAMLIACMSGANAADPAHDGAKLYGDADRGRAIAGRWCVNCHSAGPTVDDRVPSFPVLARDVTRSEGAIRAFLMQPHAPMPPLELGTQQIEDIIAYLRTFQPAPSR